MTSSAHLKKLSVSLSVRKKLSHIVAPGEALARGNLALAVQVVVGGIEAGEARGQEPVERLARHRKVDLTVGHRQLHAPEAEATDFLVRP